MLNKEKLLTKEEETKLKVVAKDLDHSFKAKSKPTQYPIFNQMEKAIESLEEGRFEVKSNEQGHTVHFKRVIVVGPLPEKTMAENIAEEYNKVSDTRTKQIHKSLIAAKEKVETALKELCNTVKNKTFSV